jgi:glycine betaine/proline transport system permease protein
MDWLIITAGDFFEALGSGVLWCLLNLERFFVWLPWPVVIATVVAVLPGP